MSNTNDIQKPATLAYEDTKKSLADIINNCGFPLFVVEPILKELLDEVRAVRKKQYETDKERYEAELKKATADEGDGIEVIDDTEAVSDVDTEEAIDSVEE